ncbi:Retrovirus-related Pol polyprotein from type-1 retrotransposable element R1 [Araneus ventricosus]|uniref:Retrovirus-related Pol polyprotein from type-1 retrotransposable element R1 n=1 Tax=Araneus ventricosus TaxID=182803 RepID=A0A4Y2NPM6_ARAVE|nr:Retrovirus-related Pol polyprotein from type-1 retrotransposable element R1 [Araneus ventricosus]
MSESPCALFTKICVVPPVGEDLLLILCFNHCPCNGATPVNFYLVFNKSCPWGWGALFLRRAWGSLFPAGSFGPKPLGWAVPAWVFIFQSPDRQVAKRMRDALGKVLDRLSTQRLFHFLLKHNKISPNQFGFTPGRSATEAIIQLKDWIAAARAQKKHSAIISLDVKSAFSRVWWPLVLHNLKKSGCPRNLFKLAASFLEGRSISFKYGDTVTSRDYSIGCPQGSNSGPLYWLLVVNDALDLDFGQDVRILAYADDIYLFVEATGKQNIKKYAESSLSKLQEWSLSAKVQFAHEKTQLIPFGKNGRHKHPPYCSFNGKAIKLARQLRILGVVLDDYLNGNPHIQHVGEKILKILNRLTIARTRRGLSGRVLKLLYKRALERILVYAAPAWWTGTVKQTTKINSIQRQILLAVTGAFRTTSTAALQIISGVEPADLVCEMETALYRIKHSLPNPNFLGAQLESGQAERYSPSWRHPGSISPATWDLNSPDFSLGIFTDGSKINGHVGAAFSVFDPIHSGDLQFRLDDHCSVFQAELTAIKQALLWKKAQRPSAHCHLFTDSLSSLKALQKFKPNNNLVEDIQDLMDGSVSLHWVKAHFGIVGNEMADKAAKEASDRQVVDIHLGIPERTTKLHVKNLLLKEWQDRWNKTDTKGRYTFGILPKVSTKICIDNHLLSQMVTNHGLCPYYLKRFQLRDCNCRCGEDQNDDIQHFLFWCPLLSSERSLLRPGMSIQQILQDKRKIRGQVHPQFCLQSSAGHL